MDTQGNRDLRLRQARAELGRVGCSQLRVLPLSSPLPRQSPASEGEEEDLLMEEEEEEVLAGVSAEDKSRRPPVKGPSEPAHPGERHEGGKEAGQGACRTQVQEEAGTGLAFSSAPPRCLADFLAPNFTP